MIYVRMEVVRLLHLLKTAKKGFESVRWRSHGPRACWLQQKPLPLFETPLILRAPCRSHQKQLGNHNAREFALHEGGYERNG